MIRLLFVAFLMLGACSFSGRSSPSILVIAVESLPFHSVSCGTSALNSSEYQGYKIFCEEAVRFTHALTPSVMSQSAMSSILTAKYPFETGVWHNGRQFLSARHRTVAEEAIENGYETLFVSGGAPLWRNSGLSQGFDVFEDNVRPRPGRYYRPAQESFDIFLTWLEELPRKQPFLSVVFVNDLQFPQVATRNKEGQPRAKSQEGQLMEVSESLDYLVRALKQRNRWASTYVVLLGTNGQPGNERDSEIAPANLFSENTQVALFIKPAQKKRDQGIEWKIDKNVSLVDVGVTLFDILGVRLPVSRDSDFPTYSLRSALEGPSIDWDADRYILTESGWPQWRNLGTTRFGLRKGHYLILYDKPLRVYNTLIDRLETTPLHEDDPNHKRFAEEVEKVLASKGYSAWEPISNIGVEKMNLGSGVYAENTNTDELIARLAHIARQRPWDTEISSWLAHLYLKNQNWKALKRLGESVGNHLWRYVAAENLGEDYFDLEGACQRGFLVSTLEELQDVERDCEDKVFVKLLRWVVSSEPESRELAREEFFKRLRVERIDKQIIELNHTNNFIWDVSDNTIAEPSLTELYLSLPRTKIYRKLSQRRMLNKR